MKKIICCLLIVVLSVAVVGCANSIQTEENVTEEVQVDKAMDGVFRYANWGDKLEIIAELEDATCVAKSDGMLIYEDIKLVSKQAKAVYSFDENGFKFGMYDILDMHTEPTSYIDDFHSVNKALIEKYGEPTDSKEKWIRDLFKDDPGLALYYSDVEYLTIWRMDDVVVMHGLRSDNFEIKHQIAYINPNAEEEIDISGL